VVLSISCDHFGVSVDTKRQPFTKPRYILRGELASGDIQDDDKVIRLPKEEIEVYNGPGRAGEHDRILESVQA